MKKKGFAALLYVLLSSGVMAADEAEELLVATVRTDKTVVPGASLKRPADFLLQRLKISNDTPDEETRKKEILETLRLVSNAAAKEKGIHVSLLADYRTVIPMTLDVAALKLTRGNRAATSEVVVCIKTPAAQGVSNAAALFAKLRDFSNSLKPPGRSAIDVIGDIEFTVVNPAQYREQVVKLYAADSKIVTTTLGPDYRVVTKGIDRQLQWMRDGLVDVVFYIPYEYDVIPTNVTSYTRSGN